MASDLDELVPQFLTIATGNISDALFELGIEPCSVPGPTALVPGQPRFAGPGLSLFSSAPRAIPPDQGAPGSSK